uniref:Acetyl-coenzyme A carboxylase carboxyl transferase subunit beta, chloroplastic n=1 Tax=Berberis dasystachya TaxID=1659732 RepID=A0A8K1ZS89_9MAGN|nr:acetyl-CoA carboxylase carboxyltransferase beta subunit [Berberis wilsoniae]UHJ17274.1 acetyl-CoA carboxylase carboxyltransferase beta subunit [Berberis dasystachya]UXW92013.1 acetyl-CoA carboxylase carboxyltransferase beta subunit [Berberis wilsoniae]
MEKEKRWINSMLFNRELEYRCALSKSMGGIEPIGNTNGSEDPIIDKNIHSWGDSASSGCENVEHLFGVRGIGSFISNKTFLVRDSNGNNYSIIFDSENDIFEIDNHPSFPGELKSSFSSYLNNGSKSDDHYYDRYMYDTKYSWNNHINSCIANYLHSEISINSNFSSGSDNCSKGYIYSYICNESDFPEPESDPQESDFDESDFDESDFDESDFEEGDSQESDSQESDFEEGDFEEGDSQESDSQESDFEEGDFEEGDSQESDFEEGDFEEGDSQESDSHMPGESNNTGINKNYKLLWVQCEKCDELNYKKFLRAKLNICEHCGVHLKMDSSDRIELSIDPGTWDPMDKYMVSVDPIEFQSEEESYTDRIDSYQKETGLTEAVQTGIGQLNGIPIAIGIMDFRFMGGSMGSVVGEKITRLIEYATNGSLPLIIVCASGGARMQEGSLSLMQMAKISSALYNYQSNKKLLYVSILTSPTTGGVTASFGMLGDIIIAEPDAYIAFAGKRVIEQTLNTTVPEGSQSAEYLFDKGLFDPIVPRNPLKGVLSELFQLHDFFPLNQNSL